jgi:hypothetical protein
MLLAMLLLLLQVLRLLAVDYLVYGKLHELALRSVWYAEHGAISRLLVAAGGGEGVSPKPELLGPHRVLQLRPPHVLVDIGQGHVEVETPSSAATVRLRSCVLCVVCFGVLHCVLCCVRRV